MIRRLFIDPGSISSGWSFFEEQECICSGTIAANPKTPAFARCAEIGRKYQCQAIELQELGFNWSETLIERIPNSCALETHHSVGVIGAALSPYSKVIFERTLIPSAWQKAMGWEREYMNLKGVKIEKVRVGNGLKMGSPLLPYVEKVRSKDELAAVGLGLFYTKRRAA